MRIYFTKKFTIKKLRKMCKCYNLKRYSYYNKQELLILLNKYKSVTYIQREFRKSLMTDVLCPISFNVLSYPFISIKSHNKFNYYDFNTLLEYFSKTKDFRDPLTRNAITDLKLQEINKLVVCYCNRRNISRMWTKNYYDFVKISGEMDKFFSKLGISDLTLNLIYGEVIPHLIFYFTIIIFKHNFYALWLINNCINKIEKHPSDNRNIIIDYCKYYIKIYNL